MQLSVIVVNYNTGDYLKDCLESLYRSNGSIEDFSITVYDNGSTDSSLEFARAHFQQVRYIGNHANVGFARAVNHAIGNTYSDYILLLNPDTVVLPGAIDMMHAFMERTPCCGILGGELLSPHGFRQPTCRRFPNYYNILFGRRSIVRRLFPKNRFSSRYLYLDIPSHKPQQVDFVEGSLMMIRKKALEDVGLFDEAFFLYLEDADMCFRMRKKGWETWWLPRCYAIHYRGENFRSDNVHPSMHHSRGFYRFFKKHYQPSTAVRSLVRILLALRLVYVISIESVKKVIRDIDFSPRQ